MNVNNDFFGRACLSLNVYIVTTGATNEHSSPIFQGIPTQVKNLFGNTTKINTECWPSPFSKYFPDKEKKTSIMCKLSAPIKREQ